MVKTTGKVSLYVTDDYLCIVIQNIEIMAPLIVSELCVRWKAEIQSFAIQWTIILNLLVMVYKIEVSRQYLKDLNLLVNDSWMKNY